MAVIVMVKVNKDPVRLKKDVLWNDKGKTFCGRTFCRQGRFVGEDVLREGRFVGGTFCRRGRFVSKDVL